MKPAFRRRLLEIRAQNEQTIDRHSIDDVLYAGFDASAVEKARAKVQDFRRWVEENRDELTALQVLYAGTRPLRITLTDLRKLKKALESPAPECPAGEPVASVPGRRGREGPGRRRQAIR